MYNCNLPSPFLLQDSILPSQSIFVNVTDATIHIFYILIVLWCHPQVYCHVRGQWHLLSWCLLGMSYLCLLYVLYETLWTHVCEECKIRVGSGYCVWTPALPTSFRSTPFPPSYYRCSSFQRSIDLLLYFWALHSTLSLLKSMLAQYCLNYYALLAKSTPCQSSSSALLQQCVG